MKTRITKLTVTPGELFHETGFEVEIVDESGGEFVEIRSNESGSPLRVDADEWPFLRDAIDRMFGEIAEAQVPPESKAPQGAEVGWIPWNGGECPVDDETRVLVHFRGDCHYQEAEEAYLWEWTHHGVLGDIIFYKVVD